MKQYIVLAVNKLKIGDDIGAFGSGVSIYTGYPLTYNKIKKYDEKKKAEAAARRLNRVRREYNAYIQEVDISDGSQKKVNTVRSHQRELSFPDHR